jgi:hypothetical protein
MRRTATQALLALVSPILAAAVIVATPAIAVLELRRALRRRAVRRAFESKWGRHGMRVVLAYSDDTRWRQRIEQQWLPRIGRRSVVLDWKTRQSFLPGAPIESHVFEHWAGSRDFDPIAIVIPAAGHVRTLRFRDAFIAHFRGDEQALALEEARLFALVESLGDETGVVAPDGVLRTGAIARRNA